MSTLCAQIRATSPIKGALCVHPSRFALLGLLLVTGCFDSAIQGTYEVTLMIDRTSAPIVATMIVTNSYLEGRSRLASPGAARDDAAGEPNSCLIIPSNDASDDTPRSVTYFQSRIRSGEFVVPTTIFETSEETIDITKVKFFANAVGGDIIFHSESGERAGRIVGDRQADPDATRCSQALSKFNTAMEELLRAAREGQEL